jgi:hypothetical protein
MTQKNQISLDSSHQNGSEAFKKRAYQSPKLYVDLLKGYTRGKAGYQSYEGRFTRTLTGNHGGIIAHTPDGQPSYYYLGPVAGS